jgi:FkbM family methyltransferase
MYLRVAYARAVSVLGRAALWARRLPPSRTTVRAGRALTAAVTRLGATAVCTTRMADGTLLELDARSRTEAGPLWTGTYEADYQRLLAALVDRFGRVAYDVGANVGLIAVPLARHIGADGHVSCFEPVPENAARLRRNLALNGVANCAVHEVALGATAGDLQIAREVHNRSTSGNAVLLSGDGPRLAGYDAVCTVPVRPLDDVVAERSLPLPNVIKLDVEGSEVGFLRGAAATLAAARPVVLGEFNNRLMPRFGTTFLDAAAALPPDYAVFSFLDATAVEERTPVPGLGDVLLAPRERIADLPVQVRQSRG